MKTFEVKSIGHVQRKDQTVTILIDNEYRSALHDLRNFSHVMVFFWASQLDQPEMREILTVDLPYVEGHKSGVFATRSPMRPNPILMTTCRIISVDESAGLLPVADLDAYDGTPVLDLKAYFPVCDRVQNAYIPEWLQGWPEWMPEDGIGLDEHEK
jgi:tRNA-Thr(GGU) m(6)t(6)A37 methyltransferase TsaA